MVFRFTCLCSNISLDLAQAPTEHNFGDKPKYKWVQLIKWKKVLKGKMSLGGVRTEHLVLVKRKNIGDGWTLGICTNCTNEVYIIDSKNSEIYLNDLPQKPIEERVSEMGSHTYSKVYRIILKEDEAAEKSLLECPDETEVEAFSVFNSLQKQLQDALAAEHKLMEERIEAFRQEQQEAFKQLQTKSYHDRKLLWHKLSEVLLRPSLARPPPTTVAANIAAPISRSTSIEYSTTPPALSASILATTNKDLLIIEDYEVSAQKTNVPKTPELPLPEIVPLLNVTDSNDSMEAPAMFDFDEEMVDENKATSNNKTEVEEEEEEEIPVENYRSRPVMKVSTDIFGTSLPVSIPKANVASTYHPRTALQRERDEMDRSRPKPPPLLTQEIIESSEDEDDIAKSFEVPLSLNSTLYRRLKSEL